jgi:hypothetical protein
MKPFAPRAKSDELKDVVLTGKLMPWRDGQPVFLALTLSDHLYLPLFSTLEEMESVLEGVAEFDKAKVIEDGDEFICSLPRMVGLQQLKVILNLRPQPDGRLLYTEVKSN